MAKGQFLDDTFEQLVELGKSTGKATGQAIKQTFGLKALWDAAINKRDGTSEVEERNGRTSEVKKGNNHTPLDFQKLQEKYKDQDKMKTDVLRQRLFQLVKSGDEKSLAAKKQKEQEKKQKVSYEEENKKKQLVEKKKRESLEVIPHGKEHRSIFSPKKMAKREQLEVRPSAGKQ